MPQGNLAWAPHLWSRRPATTEACVPRACAPQEKPPQGEACALKLESSPCSQLKKAQEQQ